MVKIINPIYGTDPTASVFANVGKQLFGGGNSNSVQREQARKLEMENVERQALARRIADMGGVQNLGADPMAQQLAVLSGYDPNDFGRLGAIGAATGSGIEDPNTSEWLVGMGEGTASPWNLNANRVQDQSQFDAELAQAMEIARIQDARSAANNAATNAAAMERQNAEPYEYLLDGQPIIGRKGDEFGDAAAPVMTLPEVLGTQMSNNWDNLGGLPIEQQRALDVDPGESDQTAEQTFAEYYKLAIEQGYPPDQAKTFAMTQAAKRAGTSIAVGPDGTTIDFSNIGLPGGAAPSTAAQMQQMEVGFNEFQSLIQTTLPFVRDPKNFGVTGNVQYLAQQVGHVLKNTGLMVGDDVEQEVLSTFKGGAEFLNNTDPSLRALQSLRVMLAYAAAKANGSVGRDLSDPEIQMNMETIGDPTGWLTSQESFLAALGTVDYTIKAKRNSRVPDELKVPLPDSLTYVKQFIAAAKAGQPVGGGASTEAAPAAPIRKTTKSGKVFELQGGAWVQVQ